MADRLEIAGKFGAPPKDPQEEATFASEWENFFTKLKSDQRMQEALLGFAANVTSGEYDNTTQAVTGALAQSVMGYNKAKAGDAAAQVKAGVDAEKHQAFLNETWSKIMKNHGLTEKAGAETARTRGGIDLDKSTIELNQARAAAARAKAANPGGDKQPTHVDKLAKAILDQGMAVDENDAYIQATEMVKTPAGAKIAADFINSQGFLYGDNLAEKTQEAVDTALQAGGRLRPGMGTQTPAGATPGLNPAATGATIEQPQIDMSMLRQLSDQYTTTRGKPPISEAKLLELSRNPTMIMQLKQAVLGAPNGQQ